ncbi:MAG: tetratricopeptide repeat protein [Syntrophorhabdales bacterium]
MGRWEEAYEEFRTASQHLPDDPSIWADLGRTLRRLGDLEGALSAHQRALALDPDRPGRHYNAGVTLLAMERFDDAIPYLRRCVRMDPDYGIAYFDLGLALCRAGRYEEGAATMKVSLRNDPGMAFGGTNLGMSVNTNVGLAHMNLGQFGEAEACFRRNLRLVAPTHYNLGLTIFKQGRYEEALPHFQRAVELEPEDPEYLGLLGDTCQRLGRLTEAREVLEKSVALDGTCARAHYDLGLVLAKMGGNEREALRSYMRALACNRELGYAHYGIACIFALQGKKRLALRFLKKSFEKDFRNMAHIDKDTDLDSLRDDPAFHELKHKYSPAGELS